MCKNGTIVETPEHLHLRTERHDMMTRLDESHDQLMAVLSSYKPRDKMTTGQKTRFKNRVKKIIVKLKDQF